MVWDGPKSSRRVQDGLGGSKTGQSRRIWKGPGWSGIYPVVREGPERSERVQEGLGGSITVWESPGWSRMVQMV